MKSTSSDTGEFIYTEQEQYRVDDAQAALKFLEGIPNEVIKWIHANCKAHNIEMSREDVDCIMGHLQDAMGDTFASERRRLLAVGGWSDVPERYIDKGEAL